MTGAVAMVGRTSVVLGRSPCSLHRAGSGELRCCGSEQGKQRRGVSRQQRKDTPSVSLIIAACRGLAW